METLAPPFQSRSELVSSRIRPSQFVVFRLNDQCFGLKLSCVQRVVRSVEITPLPNSPDIIPGLVNIQGEIIYVINTRRALGLPDRELDVTDQFILANASGRVVALVSDEVTGVQEFQNDQMTIADDLLSSSWCLYGVAKTDVGVILILDLDCMIPWDQFDGLDRAIPGNDGRLLHG
jgi:purine-binding chemotaxis protein CheW